MKNTNVAYNILHSPGHFCLCNTFFISWCNLLFTLLTLAVGGIVLQSALEGKPFVLRFAAAFKSQDFIHLSPGSYFSASGWESVNKTPNFVQGI